MRRAKRGWVLAGVWLFAMAPRVPGEAAASFTLAEVRPGVFAAIAQPGNDAAVGNAGFIVGSESVLVVDSFSTPRAAQQLLSEIRRKTPLPVRWLVNTHHHLDHCGGNAVFAKAGAAIVAHENARTRMREAARSALPTETYRDAISIWLGDRRVDVFTKPGHTDGDSLVSVPDANVLFGGDLLQKDTIPNLAQAKTDAWIQTLDELAARFQSATLVPGHGAVARPLDMRPLRDYLVGLRLAVARELRQGKTGAELSEALLPQLSSRYGRWTWSEHIGDNVAQMEAELTGRTASPPAPTP